MKYRLELFSIINCIALATLALLCLFPFVHIIAVSLSSGVMTAQNLVGLLPREFTFDSYLEAMADNAMQKAFSVSMLRILLATFISMSLTIITAYPLSLEKREFPSRKIYVWYLMIVMLFSGGLIPAYIQIARLKMMNTIWALVLPGAVPVFNVIVLLNFYRGIPLAIRDSALIDGADDFRCLFNIYVPLAKPCLATLTMFCIIGHWNAWFDGLMYMRDQWRYPLQTYLQVKITAITVIKSMQDVEQAMKVSERGLISAYIVLSCIPVLAVFPFLQRYIKHGLVLGSVKG
jgi:putative aldouronate transport system permease protein